jgi:hypothetical protein
MLYEGNDFRGAPPLPTVNGAPPPETQHERMNSIGFYAKASPVTQGLRRLAQEVLAKVGRDSPVPGYAETVGFMPLRLTTPQGVQAYSFDPKRMLYLGNTEAEFAASTDWKNVRDVLEQFVRLSQKDGFRLVFVYAPSTPHVIMPLLADRIPAVQLLNFARIKQKDLNTDPDTYKQQVLARLGSQENVWQSWCHEKNIECISTTQALRDAAATGHQVYFTYDQHWTPDGNAVVAAVLGDYFQTHGWPASEQDAAVSKPD